MYQEMLVAMQTRIIFLEVTVYISKVLKIMYPLSY